MLRFKTFEEYKAYLQIRTSLTMQFEIFRQTSPEFNRAELLDLFSDAAASVVAQNVVFRGLRDVEGLDAEHVELANVLYDLDRANSTEKDLATEELLFREASDEVIAEAQIFLAEQDKRRNEIKESNALQVPVKDTVYH